MFTHTLCSLLWRWIVYSRVTISGLLSLGIFFFFLRENKERPPQFFFTELSDNIVTYFEPFRQYWYRETNQNTLDIYRTTTIVIMASLRDITVEELCEHNKDQVLRRKRNCVKEKSRPSCNTHIFLNIGLLGLYWWVGLWCIKIYGWPPWWPRSNGWSNRFVIYSVFPHKAV